MAKAICSIDGCSKTVNGRGWCAMHYHRFRATGDPLGGKSRSTPAVVRFWSKIERTDSCWEWRGGRSSNGYGVLYVDGRQVGAHRFSYETLVGPIEGDLFVLHECDNKGCVNPEHLHLGTQADNMMERTERGRADAPRGTAHRSAKLTEDDIRAIRNDQRSLSVIANEYNVVISCISRIRNRRSWRHVA